MAVGCRVAAGSCYQKDKVEEMSAQQLGQLSADMLSGVIAGKSS